MGWKVALVLVALWLCMLAVAVAPTAASTAVSCRGAITNGSPTFLDLGVGYPNPRRFTVLIWGRDRGKLLSPESTYLGRTICVSGLIRLYRGHAEVFASSPAQIATA